MAEYYRTTLCILIFCIRLFLKDFEIENKKLRETLNEYNTEFAEVKNQGALLLYGEVISLCKAQKQGVYLLFFRGYNQSVKGKG
jgi:hypothetical protein